MNDFAQLILSGLAIGSIYALVAAGYSITYSASKTVNFAQGQSVMLGAVVWYLARPHYQLSGLPSIGVLLLTGALTGSFIYYLGVRPFRGGEARAGAVGWVLGTIAIGLAFQGLVLVTFGKEPRAIASPFGSSPVRFFGLGISPHEVFLVGVGVILALLQHLLLNRSKVGLIFKAVAANEDGARLLGIRTDAMVLASYVMTTVLAFVAGALVAPATKVSASMGIAVGVKSFAIAATAGMLWPRATVFISLSYGVLESLAAGYVGGGSREVLSLAVLLLVLSIFPDGIFERLARKV
jgi:branched-chain amino acid transport system permease protein